MTDRERTNKKRAITVFEDETGIWYTLDNAAIIMPAVANSHYTTLFRISATLSETIKYNVAMTALKRASARFPYFLVELRRGLFWYYFQPLGKSPQPMSDFGYPNMDFDIKKRGAFLFRVRLHERRIACEFSHVLTDGAGALCFIKTLLAEYARACGKDPGVVPGALNVDETPSPEEYEDAYQRVFNYGYPHPERKPRAFHQRSSPLSAGRHRVICGSMPSETVRQVAKSYNVTVTELFVAAIMEGLQSAWLSYPVFTRNRTKSVAAIEVPVNMRKFYPSRTMRNFTLFALPSVDLRLGPYMFEELVEIAHHRMAIEGDKREIAKQISRNAGGGRSLAVRLTPLFVKDIAAKVLFNSLGEGLISSYLSNLGTIELPSTLSELVERFDFIGAPSSVTQCNASVVTFKGIVRVNFGSLIQSRILEQAFFSRLSALGIQVRVEQLTE